MKSPPSVVAVAASILTAGACATASPKLPRMIVNRSEPVELAIRINDLPLSQREVAFYVSVEDLYDLPPYYFKAGANTIDLSYRAYPAQADIAAVLHVSIADVGADGGRESSFDPIVPDQIRAELTPAFTGCNDGTAKCTDRRTFTVDAQLPTWAWTTGDPIADTAETRASLVAAYTALWLQLSDAVPRDEDGLPVPGKRTRDGARRLLAALREQLPDQVRSARLAGQRGGDLDDLVQLVSHPKSGLDDLPMADPDQGDEVKLEVFAGGRLARLWRAGTIPVLWFGGGADDAPSGTMGPFSIGFDVWFRRDGDRWIPAAIWRTDPMVTLPEG